RPRRRPRLGADCADAERGGPDYLGNGPGPLLMSEAVSTEHPDYAARKPEWSLMRDASWRETAIKDGGEVYLPVPGGFTTQPDGGRDMYAAYKTRAQFPEIVAPAVLSMVGVIHQAEIKIDLPPGLEPLWERATA